jgi:hypothetical protein
MFLTAEFLKPEPVASGVSALLLAGFGKDEIDIFSDKPVELPSGLLDRPGRTSLFAVLGAMINGGLATGFVFYTQHDYPLITGGMPLVSGWATGVISWELAMAGAVAGTVLAFVWQAGLLRRRKGGPPPPLKEGSIFLQVRCSEHSAATAAECLSRAGAAEIVKQEGQ